MTRKVTKAQKALRAAGMRRASLKQTTAQRFTADELDAIPAFLRINQETRNKSWDEYWRTNPPKPNVIVPVPVVNRQLSPEAQRIVDQEAEARKIKTNNRLKALKDRCPIKDPIRNGYYWDTRRSKWMIDRFAHMKCVPKPTPGLSDEAGDDDEPCATAPRSRSKTPKPADDLTVQVKAHVHVDGAPDVKKLKVFAQLNDVWDDKYGKLNNGLQCMNVINRLRNAVRKGHAVKWPRGKK